MTDRSHHPNEENETLNTLLRNEMAAVEAYEKAMSRLEDEQVLADLQKIRDDHAHAAEMLLGEAEDRGDDPPENPGPWSTVCAAVNGAAEAISPTTALWALCQGEEHAINEYKNALEHDGLSAECKQAIRLELMPQNRRHLDDLNRLMGGMK
jgi:Domain of unknown function (DUF2383)